MMEYYTQTTYAPSPAEKRKDEIRFRTYEYMLKKELGSETSCKYIRELIETMTYIYDTVEVLPDPPEEQEGEG